MNHCIQNTLILVICTFFKEIPVLMQHMIISTRILNLLCLYTNSQLVLYSGLQTLQLSTVRAGDANGYLCFRTHSCCTDSNQAPQGTLAQPRYLLLFGNSPPASHQHNLSFLSILICEVIQDVYPGCGLRRRREF